jgi:hypothetical protein
MNPEMMLMVSSSVIPLYLESGVLAAPLGTLVVVATFRRDKVARQPPLAAVKTCRLALLDVTFPPARSASVQVSAKARAKGV